MATSRKASGKNISESARNTVAVKLRLPAEVATVIKALADANEMTVSAYVAYVMHQTAITNDPAYRKSHANKMAVGVTDKTVRRLLGAD